MCSAVMLFAVTHISSTCKHQRHRAAAELLKFFCFYCKALRLQQTSECFCWDLDFCGHPSKCERCNGRQAPRQRDLRSVNWNITSGHCLSSDGQIKVANYEWKENYWQHCRISVWSMGYVEDGWQSQWKEYQLSFPQQYNWLDYFICQRCKNYYCIETHQVSLTHCCWHQFKMWFGKWIQNHVYDKKKLSKFRQWMSCWTFARMYENRC